MAGEWRGTVSRYPLCSPLPFYHSRGTLSNNLAGCTTRDGNMAIHAEPACPASAYILRSIYLIPIFSFPCPRCDGPTPPPHCVWPSSSSGPRATARLLLAGRCEIPMRTTDTVCVSVSVFGTVCQRPPWPSARHAATPHTAWSMVMDLARGNAQASETSCLPALPSGGCESLRPARQGRQPCGRAALYFAGSKAGYRCGAPGSARTDVVPSSRSLPSGGPSRTRLERSTTGAWIRPRPGLAGFTVRRDAATPPV